MTNRFWESKALVQLSASEWESLCDGCGLCCLHKLEDEDDGEVYYTDVACDLLATHTARCTDYEHRKSRVPDCLTVTPENIAEYDWLPPSCAYRLVYLKQPLPNWHPLETGDPNSTQHHGPSVAGRVLSARFVKETDLEDHIVHWVDE